MQDRRQNSKMTESTQIKQLAKKTNTKQSKTKPPWFKTTLPGNEVGFFYNASKSRLSPAL